MRLFRARELSPVEVLDAHLERIEALDPELNAYVTVLGEDARGRARDAERAIRAGVPLGPLHGVPAAIKDLFDFKAGAPHGFGFLDPGRWSPTSTSLPVKRLERAGAIVIGKTATPALGHRLTTDGPLRGPTSTPFAPGHNAGGSSGGSAAAVAAGMATVALGSDAAGSLRVPASLCGVFSLKPTYGRVPSAWRPNAFRSLTPMGQVGPIARTVADAACVLEAIAGPHRADPMSLPGWRAGALDPTAASSLSVAYSPDFGTFPVAPEVSAAVESGLDALKAAGVRVERVNLELPHHEELFGILRRLFNLGLLDAVSALEREGIALDDGEAPPDAALLEMIEQAVDVRAVDLKADEARRTDLLDALEDALEGHDAIVTPVTCVAAVRNAVDGRTRGPSEVEGRPVDPLLGWSLAYPLNLTGHPAASVPAGFSDGSPIGMQIVGRRFEEGTVIALAAAVERSTAPWAPMARSA
ncbi:MAG TPA: amidase family protein [Solirubrobacterales bacterium]|nr:amidase family protein [Solirubrobacterales bacterium]